MNRFLFKVPRWFLYGKLGERAAKRDGWTSLKLWHRGHGNTGCIGLSLYPCDPNRWSRTSKALHLIVGGARPTDQGDDDVEFLNPRFGERNLECSVVGNKNLLPKFQGGNLSTIITLGFGNRKWSLGKGEIVYMVLDIIICSFHCQIWGVRCN